MTELSCITGLKRIWITITAKDNIPVSVATNPLIGMKMRHKREAKVKAIEIRKISEELFRLLTAKCYQKVQIYNKEFLFFIDL